MRNLKRMRSEEGVASTVGTLMALLVFLMFLSLITNQYVPVWMKDSEASHMNVALGQFSSLKSSIDLQNLAAQGSGPEYVPVTTASAVTLGVDGVPIFAVPTLGELSSDPDDGGFTVTFDYLIPTPSGGDIRIRVREQSNGSVALDVVNRYYTRQKIAFENGAVIRSQQDGQVVRAQPTFLVTETNHTLQIRMDLVSLYGRGSVSGTSTEVVNSRLFATDLQTYDRFPNNAVIWVNHTSEYGLAWYHFWNETLEQSLHLGGTYAGSPLDQSFTARMGGAAIYRVSVTYLPTTGLYITRLEIRNNPGLLDLDSFRLRHAQVQIGVGEAPENALK
ncbi:MAG TPA: hypothetical protein VGR51_10350 [Thermoplasmata archaeon]|jgi:hypothetical protein|nr:hypothetical protein [Thermoplasmata archaeon]